MSDLSYLKQQHARASERTMLSERYIACICGHEAQGPVYGDSADRNFAYHLQHPDET